jgi:hypothetical protein
MNFICGLFNDAVSISGYKVSNEKMINEQLLEMILKEAAEV